MRLPYNHTIDPPSGRIFFRTEGSKFQDKGGFGDQGHTNDMDGAQVVDAGPRDRDANQGEQAHSWEAGQADKAE